MLEVNVNSLLTLVRIDRIEKITLSYLIAFSFGSGHNTIGFVSIYLLSNNNLNNTVLSKINLVFVTFLGLFPPI